MLLVSRVENADMFALYFLGKPSSIYDKDNPDWAPSQKLGYDCNKVKESSQERYNRAQERVEKRRRSEGAIALWNCQNQPWKRLWTPVLLWKN